jgi:hypothetical protein
MWTLFYRINSSGTVCLYPFLVHRLARLHPDCFQRLPYGVALALRPHFTSIRHERDFHPPAVKHAWRTRHRGQPLFGESPEPTVGNSRLQYTELDGPSCLENPYISNRREFPLLCPCPPCLNLFRPVVECRWVKVRAIRPNQCVNLRINPNLVEQ